MRYLAITILACLLGMGIMGCSEAEDISTGVATKIKQSDVTKDQANLMTLQQSANNFRAMNGRWPESLEELKKSARLNIDISLYEYDPATGKVTYEQKFDD